MPIYFQYNGSYTLSESGNRVLLTIYEHLFARLDKQCELGIVGLRVMKIY